MKKQIRQNKKRKGFTLIELIVVIAILAVLSVGAVVAYSNIADQAQDAADNANAAAIARALNTYNAVAATKITTAPSYSTVTTGLKTGTGDLIAGMNLCVTIDSTSFTAAMKLISYDTAGAAWVIGATGSTGT